MKRTPLLMIGFIALITVIGLLSYAAGHRTATSSLLPFTNPNPFIGTWARTEQQDGYTVFETLILSPDGTGNRISDMGRSASDAPRKYEDKFNWHKDGANLDFLYTSKPDAAAAGMNLANSERFAWSLSEDSKSLSLTFGSSPSNVYFRNGMVNRPFSQAAVSSDAPVSAPAQSYAPAPNNRSPSVSAPTGPAGGSSSQYKESPEPRHWTDSETKAYYDKIDPEPPTPAYDSHQPDDPTSSSYVKPPDYTNGNPPNGNPPIVPDAPPAQDSTTQPPTTDGTNNQ